MHDPVAQASDEVMVMPAVAAVHELETHTENRAHRLHIPSHNLPYLAGHEVHDLSIRNLFQRIWNQVHDIAICQLLHSIRQEIQGVPQAHYPAAKTPDKSFFA